MNLILLFESDFIQGGKSVRLHDRRLRHVMSIHRAQAGDELIVGLAGGPTGTGIVTAINNEVLEMDVKLFSEPPPALPVTLVLSLPRPKVLRRVLLSVAAMGVKRIFLLNSYRVEKSFWQSPFLKKENLDIQLMLGLEQARDTIFPEVFLRPLFKPFVEDELPGLREGTTSLVAHPSASEPCPRVPDGHVTLAIGPEGGFIPYEIDKLRSIEFTAVHLGERVLSVETAVPFILSRLV